jgi:hypothetical protein
MEALNALIAAAEHDGLLQTLCPQVINRTALYADDVVVFVAPEETQLVTIMATLEIFAEASGLRENHRKVKLLPSNVTLKKLAQYSDFSHVACPPSHASTLESGYPFTNWARRKCNLWLTRLMLGCLPGKPACSPRPVGECSLVLLLLCIPPLPWSSPLGL